MDIANQMFDYITAGISSLIDDDALTRMARGTCLGIVELVLSMMEHAIPADHAEPPVVATEYVRLIAGRGIPLEDVLRSYRLGHACFARIWADAIMELTQDPAELVRGVRDTERFLFAFIDIISSKVSAVYLQQREHLHSHISSARGDIVRAILAGDNIDITSAEVALGHCHRPTWIQPRHIQVGSDNFGRPSPFDWHTTPTPQRPLVRSLFNR